MTRGGLKVNVEKEESGKKEVQIAKTRGKELKMATSKRIDSSQNDELKNTELSEIK